VIRQRNCSMSDEENLKNKCTVCKKIKASNICEHCTSRYGGVSMHLSQKPAQPPSDFAALQIAILNGTMERAADAPGPGRTKSAAEEKVRDCPTVDDVVAEEDSLANRLWEWNLQKNMPVAKVADDGRIANAPWGGSVDMKSIVKDNVPIGMCGSGMVYFNAAKYKAGKFKGLLDMLDIINLPKDQFVYFTKESENPVEEGYLTMWRIVSRDCYAQYHRQKFESDPNPDRTKPKKGLYQTLTKLCADEMKKYGKGKLIPIPKPEKGEDEEEEEEEEAAEVDESDVKGRENLNAVMKLSGFAKTFGEWALGFGFMVENDHYKTYRLWSRPIFHPAVPEKEDPNKNQW